VFLGRVLIAVLFLGEALQKANDPAPAMALLSNFGLAAWLVWPALMFNALVGVALIAGARRGVAPLAAGYCAVTSVFLYLPDDPWQMTIFVKKLVDCRGCFDLAVLGAGTWIFARALRPRP
jgi:putative oxidoreductase